MHGRTKKIPVEDNKAGIKNLKYIQILINTKKHELGYF